METIGEEFELNSFVWPNGYNFFPDIAISRGRYALRPITWEDRTYIRRWRNEQISVLRQREPLSLKEQNQYFRDVVATQMYLPKPAQVLVAYLEDNSLVGYGGLVHIQWERKCAEVSFLTETRRNTRERFKSDWFGFLNMVREIAVQHLSLHKLTVEVYSVREDLEVFIKEYGFVQEETVIRRQSDDSAVGVSHFYGFDLKA